MRAWLLCVALMLALPAHAKNLRWASQGDATSMDPHAQNENLTNQLNGMVYEQLLQYDKQMKLVPWLATSFENPEPTKWIFHLRKGVKFHDGSEFNADAAIWNLDRYYKKDAKQFDPPGGAVAQARNPFVAGYRKIDDYTIEIANPRPLSYFPNMLPYMLYSSPAQFEKTGSWAEFA